jgi:hypothetical protein
MAPFSAAFYENRRDCPLLNTVTKLKVSNTQCKPRSLRFRSVLLKVVMRKDLGQKRRSFRLRSVIA